MLLSWGKRATYRASGRPPESLDREPDFNLREPPMTRTQSIKSIVEARWPAYTEFAGEQAVDSIISSLENGGDWKSLSKPIGGGDSFDLVFTLTIIASAANLENAPTYVT